MPGLLRGTLTVGAMTLASRVLGFARDVVIATVFGAGLGTDAFFVAFRIPNFLRRLFAEGAFAQAFVPVLAEWRERRGARAVRELVAATAGTLGATLTVVSALGALAAPLLVHVFAPGFALRAEPGKAALAADLLRLTFPYLLFVSLTALAGGVLNTFGRFAVPALTPALLNLSLIGAALWLAPRLERPVEALAWGVFAAGAAQLTFQLPFLARLGLLARPRWGWRHPGVRRILRLMGPGVIGSSVAQVNLLIDTVIASFLVTGSVSWLYYADRLVEFPLGVFGIALGTVALPALSARHAAGDGAGFAATLDRALRWVALVSLPAALGLALLAGPILASLFGYGAFGARDVEMSARALAAYALGLPAFVLVKVLAPGYYARQDTRTPVRVALLAMGANTALNLLLVVPLAHAGLALASSLAAWLNAGLLYRGLRRQGVLRHGDGWPRYGAQLGLGLAALAAVLLAAGAPPEAWTASPWQARAATLALWIAAGAGAYFGALWLAGWRPRAAAGGA